MRRAMWMRIVVAVALVAGGMSSTLPAWAAAPAKKSESAKRKASKGDWPETPAGERARQWVEAFARGEDAMRTFYQQHLADEALAERGMTKRIERYRKLREQYGNLVLASVDKVTAGEVTATLMSSDASSRIFVFKVQKAVPYKLLSVGIMERRHSGHSGFHH